MAYEQYSPRMFHITPIRLQTAAGHIPQTQIKYQHGNAGNRHSIERQRYIMAR